LAEVCARLLDLPPRPLAPLSDGPRYRLSASPVLRYEYVPNQEGGTSGRFSINSDGFRDIEHVVAKTQGVTRIMVLGDSITAGNGIEDPENVFTRVLDELLTARGASCEVFNLGVGGYQTLQEVEALRLHGLAYKPDLVMIAFCINDFDLASDGGVWESLARRNEGFDVARWRSVTRSWLGPILRASRLAFFAYHRLSPHLEQPPSQMDYITEILKWRTPVEAGLDLLVELRAEHGFEALVVLIPAFDRPFEEYAFGKLHDAVAELAGERGVDVLDLREDFAALDEDARVFGSDGIHPNVRGHRALAEILAQRLDLP